MDVAGALGTSVSLLIIPLIVMGIIAIATYVRADSTSDKTEARLLESRGRILLGVVYTLIGLIVLGWFIAVWLGFMQGAVVNLP